MHIVPLQVKQQQAITLPMNSSEIQKWLWLTMLMSHTSRHEEMLFPSATTAQFKHLQWANSFSEQHNIHPAMKQWPHAVRVQEADSMNSNMQKVMSLSECFTPFYHKSSSSFVLKHSSTTCTILLTVPAFQMYFLYIQDEVLYIPQPINLCLVDVRRSEDETRCGRQSNTLFRQPKVLLHEHVLTHQKEKEEGNKKIYLQMISFNQTVYLEMSNEQLVSKTLNGKLILMLTLIKKPIQ